MFFSKRARIVIVMMLTLSFLGSTVTTPHLIPSARANVAPSSRWVPAGPMEDKLQLSIFTDQTAEFTCLQQTPPCVDLTDSPLTPAIVPLLTGNPNYLVTSPVAEHGYYELEFNLANNYWGVSMNFGNDPSHATCVSNPATSACAGLNIRQGIAHLLDKNVFVSNDPTIAGRSIAIDNPVPSDNGGLPGALPCGWDILFPQSGSNCVVGAPGGTAYHLAASTGTCGPSSCNFPGMQDLISPDFCAAAAHFIDAGLATGTVGYGAGAPSSSTCALAGRSAQLTGIAPTVSINPVGLFARVDDPARYNMGNAYAGEICALFTGAFLSNCSPYLTTTPGVSTSFPGYTTPTSGVSTNWWIYTASFRDVYPFDRSLLTYNSRFVSGTPTDSPPCLGPVPSSSASDYMYNCLPAFDTASTQMESAPCLSAPGDPVPGQTALTLANCPSTTQLTAVSAGYQSEDILGMEATTIPSFTTRDQYAYLSGWTGVNNGAGTGPPDYFSFLNAWNSAPAVSGTLRLGFAQTARNLNPFLTTTPADQLIVQEIFDTLLQTNPYSPTQSFGWLASFHSAIGPQPRDPTGTKQDILVNLRPNIYWHDGVPVTANDVKFSILGYLQTGGRNAQLLSGVIDVTILDKSDLLVNLNNTGIFAPGNVGSVPIVPQHVWASATATPCTTRGTASCTVNPTFLAPSFDPVANHVLIGSGPYECRDLSTMVVGGGCSSTGTQSPPSGGSITLQRFGFGFSGTDIAHSYVHDSAKYELWQWADQNANGIVDRSDANSIVACFNQPIGTPGCAHWQAPAASTSCVASAGSCNSGSLSFPPGGNGVVTSTQVSELSAVCGSPWTAPLPYGSLTNVQPFPVTLFEGGVQYAGGSGAPPASPPIIGCTPNVLNFTGVTVATNLGLTVTATSVSGWATMFASDQGTSTILSYRNYTIPTITFSSFGSGAVRFLFHIPVRPYNLSEEVVVPQTGSVSLSLTRDLDININGQIDIVDFTFAAFRFDSMIGDPLYDPRADFGAFGSVNIIDIGIISFYFDALEFY